MLTKINYYRYKKRLKLKAQQKKIIKRNNCVIGVLLLLVLVFLFFVLVFCGKIRTNKNQN